MGVVMLGVMPMLSDHFVDVNNMVESIIILLKILICFFNKSQEKRNYKKSFILIDFR